MTLRQPRYQFGEPYIKAYEKPFQAKGPEEDFDDRNVLCSMHVFSLYICIFGVSDSRSVGLTCTLRVPTRRRRGSVESES